MLKIPLDIDKVNPLFINYHTLTKSLAYLDYRVDDAKIQIDTIRNALSNLKLNISLQLISQKKSNGSPLLDTDDKLNTALQLALLKSEENIALLNEYFKISKILIQRIKKASICSSECVLYKNIISEYLLDKEQLNLSKDTKEF
jgi:hypothetical protein